MRVAVTGGSGRIGSAVVKELAERGHEVLNLDRRAPAEPLPARFIYLDLARRELVQPALEQVDAVCHLGEIPHVHGSFSPEEVFSTNARIGSTVLQTAADLGLRRVISTSTCQVYGAWDEPLVPPRHLPMDETHPVAPQNAYALAKVANELYARMLADHRGVSVAIFRLPWVLSAKQEYSDAWADSLRGKATRTDGMATYVHARDVARAYALALERPRAGCEVYHLSAAEVMSLHPLPQRLREHCPDYPPLPPDWPPFKSPLLASKAREHFGWEPTWNFLDFYRARHGEP